MTTNSREYARKYYAEHREMFREASRRYQEKKKLEKRLGATNPRLFDMREDFIQQTKEDFKAVPQQRSSYQKDYYDANKERIREYQRAYREKKKRRDYQKAYYEANRERITAQQREYHSKKAKEKRMSKTFLGRVALKVKKFFS